MVGIRVGITLISGGTLALIACILIWALEPENLPSIAEALPFFALSAPILGFVILCVVSGSVGAAYWRHYNTD